MDTPVFSDVVGLVGLPDAQQAFGDVLKGPVGLTGRGERQRVRRVESGQTGVRHKNVPQTESVDGADEQVGGIAQAQSFKAAAELAGALLAVGYAGDAARGPHVFCKYARQLEYQRCGLAAARSGQHHTMAGRIIGCLLARIVGQVRRLPGRGSVPFEVAEGDADGPWNTGERGSGSTIWSRRCRSMVVTARPAL